MAKEVFREEHVEQLKSALYSISPRLFMFTNRGGQCAFPVYSPNTGSPMTGDIIAIFHKGYGACSMMDGGAIPREGVHVLENGWGLAVVNIGHSGSNAATIMMARQMATQLMWELRTGLFEIAKAGIAGRLSLGIKYFAHRVAKKIAAARAA